MLNTACDRRPALGEGRHNRLVSRGVGPAAAEAPGTSIAGCPGKLHLTHTIVGLFAYTLERAAPATKR